jgi:hypothetical protein
VVIIYIAQVGYDVTDVHQNEKMLDVPVHGYVATSRRVNQKEWEDSMW